MTVHNATTIYAFPRIERFGSWRDELRLRATGDDDGLLEYLDVFEDVRDNLLLRNTTIQSPADIPHAIKTLDNIFIPVALPSHLNGTIGLVVYRNNSVDRSLDALVPIDVNVCLVALAQQSIPASVTVLDNTSGGMGSLKTAARIATIEVSHRERRARKSYSSGYEAGFAGVLRKVMSSVQGNSTV
ncbi:hypothetical protein MN608_04017 [Microdochium nivale]|nr:hypothetical protein MN608_04017 [Microdochium nivale]